MITSSSNAKVRHVIRLNTKAKARRESGCFVAEGYRIFRETPESLRRAVFVSEAFAAQNPAFSEVNDRTIEPDALPEVVSDAVFRKMCDTQTPQGILTVAEMPHWSREALLAGGTEASGRSPLVLVLENVQDPGNVGTIIRTAEGAGVTGVVLCGGTADVFAPKVIRSTMGSIFRVPLIRTEDPAGMLTWLHARGITSFASHLEGSVPYTEAPLARGAAILIGNEGNGLSEELTALAGCRIRIPMDGAVESLNASIAAAVLMYEAHRQRTAAVPGSPGT